MIIGKDTKITIKYILMKQFFIIITLSLSFCRCTSLNDMLLEPLQVNNAENRTVDKNIQSLIFTEILFNPVKDGSEYIEIYNASENAINLSTICLDKSTPTGKPSHYPLTGIDAWLNPKAYAIVTKSIIGITDIYTVPSSAHLYEISKFPQLSNEEAILSLYSIEQDCILDEVYYSKKWHTIPLKETKGVSIERIQLAGETQDINNWQSAARNKNGIGGTPGYINSVNENIPDEDEDDQENDDNEDKEDKTDFLDNCITPEGIEPPQFNSKTNKFTTQFHLHRTGYSAKSTLFDLHGKTIASLPISENLSTSGVIIWSKRNTNGTILNPGIYIFHVDFYHPEGYTQRFKHAFAIP